MDGPEGTWSIFDLVLHCLVELSVSRKALTDRPILQSVCMVAEGSSCPLDGLKREESLKLQWKYGLRIQLLATEA